MCYAVCRPITMAHPAVDVSRYERSESRISYCTLLFGVAAAVPVALSHGWHWGAGILIGAVLAWLNFHWLKQGLDALAAAASSQSGHPAPRVPVATYVKALFRYGLIALAVYVIFKYLNVPVLSMVLGLCALGAAAFVVSVHEILHAQD